MSQVSRHECLFCPARGKLTREHIFGDWLDRTVKDERIGAQHFVRVGGQGAWQKGRLTHQSTILGTTLRCVCSGCNNGWMSRIQSAVQPVMQSLLDGGLRELSSDEALRLALWATTASMVLDAADPPTQVIPRSQRHAFAAAGEDRKPPLGWQIFVAPYGEPDEPAAYFHRALVFPDAAGQMPKHITENDTAQLSFLTVGKLLFHLFSHQNVRVNVHPRDYALILGLQPIWPANLARRGQVQTQQTVQRMIEHGPDFWVKPE